MSALRTEKKQIGEFWYEVTLLDAMKGRKVLARLQKVVAPAVGGAIASVANSKADSPEAANAQAFAEGLKNLSERLTEDDFEYLCDVFAAATCVVIPEDGKPDRRPSLSKVFALHFAGKYAEMLEWLLFCIEVNFGNFFDLLRQKLSA